MNVHVARNKVVSCVAGIALAALLATGPSIAQTTERVSVSSAGVQGNAWSGEAAVSANGQFVAFTSSASNLVAADTNGVGDVFVRNQQSGVVELVSVSTSSAQGNASSGYPSISADGRFVAFHSSASNLVVGDTNSSSDVFVRDRQNATTERVSINGAGVQGVGNSYYPSISADGRFVTFDGPVNFPSLSCEAAFGYGTIFLHDRISGGTGCVSGTTYYETWWSSISADGRYIAFCSRAYTLVAGDTNLVWDVFVSNRQTGAIERVSIDSAGTQGNLESMDRPSISADGRFVAFRSFASNLVAGDTNGFADVFVRDRQNGTTQRVSVDSAGTQENAACGSLVSISSDGRFVVFDSPATNLVQGDTNGVRDIFVHDRQSGTTERVSVHLTGAQGNSNSQGAALSGDGRLVAFSSDASNLIASDTNGFGDVFLSDRGQPQIRTSDQPNLQVTAITYDYQVGHDNACSVRFYVTVVNAGTAPARSFCTGMNRIGGIGWERYPWLPPIVTCTGAWTALGTSRELLPGQSRTILVYGPGYSSDPVPKGSVILLVSYADIFCSNGESNEQDNAMVKGLVVGL